MVNKHQNSMNKSKLVSVCSTGQQQDAFLAGHIYKPLLYKGASKSEKTQVQVTIPSFPENLLYYEHYKTPSCRSSNRLSMIVVGGDDNGHVDADYFTHYDQVFSVDFSQHLRSVAAAFHVASQLASCEDVQFHLGESNIELSITDNWLSTKGIDRTFTSTTVKYLKIRAEAIKEEKWEAGLTRVDEILKYAKAHWPNLQVVNIQLRVPTVATRAKYERTINEFLLDLLPKLVAHRTGVQGGVVRCEPKAAADEEIIVEQKKNPFRLQESRRSFFEKGEVRPPPPPTLPALEGDHHHHGAFGTSYWDTFATTFPVPAAPPAALLQQSSSSSSPFTPNHVGTAPPTNKMRIKRKNYEPNRTLANNRGNNIKIEKGDDNVGAGADQDNHEDETSEQAPKMRNSQFQVVQQFLPSHSTTPSSNLAFSSTSSSCPSAFRSAPSSSHSSPVVDNHNHMPPQSCSSSSSAYSFPPLKGSTFENSSGDHEEQEPSRSPPRRLLCTTSAYLNPTFDLNALKPISFDKEKISNIINTANANAIETKKQQQQQRSTIKPRSSSHPLVEGVHYYRRPKKIK